MDSELKIPVITGVSVLALSMLIGIVSKVGFGVVVVRALVLALVFGAAAFGISRIVNSFLLSGPSDAAFIPSDTEASSEAHSVNIVLPGGDGLETEESLVGEPMGRSFDRNDIDASEELASDLEAEAVVAGNESFLPGDGAGSDMPQGVARPPVVFEDLDVLPDLDGFAGTFEGPSGTVDESPALGSVNRPAPPDGVSYAEGTNPTEIAMAIRTILKKDQKG